MLEGYNENYVYGLESIFRKDDSKIMQITASLKWQPIFNEQRTLKVWKSEKPIFIH
jgi:hypothetical protein